MYDTAGVVGWGFQKYEDTPIPTCGPVRHATSMSGAISQLSHGQGTVTRAARPATKLGLTGTYLRLSIPYDMDCPNGLVSGGPDGVLARGAGAPTGRSTSGSSRTATGCSSSPAVCAGTRRRPRGENLDRTLDTLHYLPTNSPAG